MVVEENTSIWYGVCIRSDMDKTIIGKNTNIQENSTLHNDFGIPTIVGDEVTIGHNCVIHGCKISNNVLIGMGSVILNGAEIGENTIIGAGSLVTQNKKIPSGVSDGKSSKSSKRINRGRNKIYKRIFRSLY